MNTTMFPVMVDAPVQVGKASYEQKCLFHERILYQYLSRKMEGFSVKDFLDTEQINNYALYALTDFTYLCIKDLSQNDQGSFPHVIADKTAGKNNCNIQGIPVIEPEEMVRQYQQGDIDKIIVMSVLHENEIIDWLLNQNIRLDDIISFVSVLFS